MKLKTISLLEFDYHPEVLRNTCIILQSLDIDIKIFTTRKIWKEVNLFKNDIPSNFRLYLYDNNSFRKYLHNNINNINKSDIVLFNTLASKFRIFSKLKFSPPVVLRIHNTNAYFNSFKNTYNPKFTLFFLWKDFSHFVRNSLLRLDWYYRKRFLDKTDFFAFPSKTILEYAVNHYNLKSNQVVELPISFCSEIDYSKKNNSDSSVTTTIIGKVDQRNRDYSLVYNAFKKLLKENHLKIKLILLGKSNSNYGKNIVKLFRSLQYDNFTFISFENYVEQQQFVKHILETDFLIVPIKTETRFTIYNEKYGYTKISGSINDMIKYKKPALVYSEYPLDEKLLEIATYFSNSQELAEKITKWSKEKIYQNINLDEALSPYKLENIRSKFSANLNKLLK